MADSRVIVVNGVPRLEIGGKTTTACAYMTYFDERNRYEDFATAGYRMYSVNVSLSSMPLNPLTGFAPFTGVFDDPGGPDFRSFDRDVRRVLAARPDAWIFPRIRITMPRWWVDSHPEETVQCKDGNRREALYSPAFRQTGDQMLRQLLKHIQTSDYAEHIIGYHITGGSTQEWLHFDWMGSASGCTDRLFNQFLRTQYPQDYTGFVKAPTDYPYRGNGRIKDLTAQRFLEFCSEALAETVMHFARTVKECVDNRQIVGVFYGYTMEVVDPLSGTHALHKLLDCPDIDFFSSPNAYVTTRPLGADWPDMIPGESVKLHGKLHILECDIRTFLSDYPENCRPGCDPKGNYNNILWKGPPTPELSVTAVRKSFARQLTKGNGLWWFDMWGGWYEHPMLMDEMKRCLQIMAEDDLRTPSACFAEVAVFFDETMYRYLHLDQPICKAQKLLRNLLSKAGAPWDALLIEDAAQCLRYKAVVVPSPIETEHTAMLRQICAEHQIPFLQPNASHWQLNTEQVRQFYRSAGVWCWCESDDVLYAGRGYLAIHATQAGSKVLHLPGPHRVTPLDWDTPAVIRHQISIIMQEFETRLFRIEPL